MTMYKVSFDKGRTAFYGMEKELYEAGEVVKFMAPSISDTSFYFSSEQVDVKDDPEVNRGYFFVMPECDVAITVREKSTMTAYGIDDLPNMGMGFPIMGNMMDYNGQVPPNPSVSAPQTRFCPECGALNYESSKFCRLCGNKL